MNDTSFADTLRQVAQTAVADRAAKAAEVAEARRAEEENRTAELASTLYREWAAQIAVELRKAADSGEFEHRVFESDEVTLRHAVSPWSGINLPARTKAMKLMKAWGEDRGFKVEVRDHGHDQDEGYEAHVHSVTFSWA